MKKLMKIQLGLDILSLIEFGTFAVIDRNVGFFVASGWIFIAMLSHINEYDRYKKE